MSLFRTASAPVQVPRYTGLQVQTASSALPIPIVYGTARLAPNLIWNGAFRAFPQYSKSSAGKGGGHSSVSGYTYATSALFAIGEGPVAGLGTVWRGGGTYTAASFYLSLFPGTTPQQPWGYLDASFPQAALPYGGTAYAATSYFDLGTEASIGTIAFEVMGRLAAGVVNGHDADPALVVADFLTSPQYGVGFPAASLSAPTGVSGDASYGSWCRAAGLAFSPCLSDRESAATILTRWLTLTGATAVWSGGRLRIVPLADAAVTGTLADGTSWSFMPNTVPAMDLTDDDFVHDPDADPVLVTRTDPYAAPNVQRLEMLDRANAYSPTPVEARDQNAIDSYGPRPGSAVTAHEICDLGVAATSAQLILARGLYVRNSYAFRLSWDCGLLEPADLVTLTDANLGLDRTPVRITSISEGSDGLLDVTAEEYPGTVAGAAGYPVAGSAGAPLDRNVAPAPVNPPVIFEPPPELSGDAAQVWIGVSGGSNGVADPNWGGATVYVSTDNATYTAVGTVSGPAHQGVLAAPLTATATSAAVSLAASGGALALAGGGPPLPVWIDGEIVGAASAALTGAGAYTLGGLARRLYGQRGGAHAAGVPVLALDSAVFRYAVPPAAIGQPLWLKFASFNLFGGAPQDLSTCTAYPFTPIGSGLFGPVAQAIAVGTSSDDGLASGAANESDSFGLASDPYTELVDMGLASDGAQALALGAGGTGAVTPATARANLGAAAAGVNADIASLTDLAGIGIGTAVDTVTNLFAMKSSAALFDNAGAGVQVAINKAAAGATAAHLFETGYSGRAQAGLLGSDRYRIAVSAAGSSFTQALDVDPATGHVGLAGYTADAGNALGVTGTACLFTAGTDSMRFTFNKVAAANDAILSFQTGFSARALLGTTGSDAFQLKVSPDGSSFYQVFVVDQATGNAAFKALLGLATYTVASLPSAAFNGALAFAGNGRKTAEAAGAGTGVMVVYSSGAWRRLSDDGVVSS